METEKTAQTEKELPKNKADVFKKPSKKALIAVSFLAILLFVGSGVLGYFYYTKLQENKALVSQKDQLSSQLEEKTRGEGETGTKIEDLEKQIEDYKAKIAKAQAYNEFFKYQNYVTEIHNGYTGWTDAEYQHGRALAVKTGNSSFISVVDTAWTRADIAVTTRLISVWKAIAAGIEAALK